MKNVDRLISIAGKPLRTGGALSLDGPMASSALANDLIGLAKRKDGFYAFESALHVLPFASTTELGIVDWNDDSVWKYEYNGAADQLLCFAEDVFGAQFAIAGEAIVRFDPETGMSEEIARSIDAWASQILGDADVLTGYPIAHEWQIANGPIPIGHRLVPRVPFVLGGDFSVGNLRAVKATNAMRFYGYLATQIKTLPDGARIELRVVD